MRRSGDPDELFYGSSERRKDAGRVKNFLRLRLKMGEERAFSVGTATWHAGCTARGITTYSDGKDLGSCKFITVLLSSTDFRSVEERSLGKIE